MNKEKSPADQGSQNNLEVNGSIVPSFDTFAWLVVYSLCGYSTLKGSEVDTLLGLVEI